MTLYRTAAVASANEDPRRTTKELDQPTSRQPRKRSCNNLSNDLGTHWLGYEVIHARRQTVVPILAHRRCGHGNNGYMRPIGSSLRGYLRGVELTAKVVRLGTCCFDSCSICLSA